MGDFKSVCSRAASFSAVTSVPINSDRRDIEMHTKNSLSRVCLPVCVMWSGWAEEVCVMLRMLGEEQGSCIILITLVSIAAVVIRLLVGIKVPHEHQEHEVCLCLRATLLTFGVNQVFSRWGGGGI